MEIKTFFQKLKKSYPDCDFAIIPLTKLDIREKKYFNSFMPDAKSAIVIIYHVKNIKDWIWYCPDGTAKSERCNINDWCNDICNYIKSELDSKKINTKIVPYPHESGLQFRYMALASGYGEIGKNAFYLHPEYGPRVNLGVIASELESDIYTTIYKKINKVCLNCNKCITNCPANAFKYGFDGLKCREYRKAKGEYQPYGKKGILRYCMKCFILCKAGKM